VPSGGSRPTQKSRRGRPPWRDGYEEVLAYNLSEVRNWTHREIYDYLNEMRQELGKPPLEDVIGSPGKAAYYRCIRDRIDAGRARVASLAYSDRKRWDKLLRQDRAHARRMARLVPVSDQGTPTRFFTPRKGGRGPAPQGPRPR